MKTNRNTEPKPAMLSDDALTLVRGGMEFHLSRAISGTSDLREDLTDTKLAAEATALAQEQVRQQAQKAIEAQKDQAAAAVLGLLK